MTLTLWGDDIPKVKPGATIEILNGFTNTFKGQVSLTKGKFGQLNIN
jgi:replication factor A1